MTSLKNLLEICGANAVESALYYKERGNVLGRNTMPRLCLGTSIKTENFSVPLDSSKDQWTNNCPGYLDTYHSNSERCSECNKIWKHNNDSLHIYRAKIVDYSKIRFDKNGTIVLTEALKKVSEPKEGIQEEVVSKNYAAPELTSNLNAWEMLQKAGYPKHSYKYSQNDYIEQIVDNR